MIDEQLKASIYQKCPASTLVNLAYALIHLPAYACFLCHLVVSKSLDSTSRGITTSPFFLLRRIHEFSELQIVKTCLLLSTFAAMSPATSSRFMIFKQYICSIIINCAFACSMISSIVIYFLHLWFKLIVDPYALLPYRKADVNCIIKTDEFLLTVQRMASIASSQ